MNEGKNTDRPHSVLKRALRPVERFLAIEAASGIVLVLAALIALVWANSPFRETYHRLWHAVIPLRVAGFSFERDLHFWVNDGLMTIFFFTVGLEIRREMHHGELSDLKRAALPLAAALGGMLVPAAIFVAINRDHEAIHAWGVPMATDIAFAVGVLTLLGKRVPASMRILLLALAVIDDIGAIVVIALFYTSDLGATGFLVAGGGIVAVLLLRVLGAGSARVYILPGAVVWAGVLASGVHPTIAGVALGLLTPVEAPRGGEGSSPLERIEQALHGYVAFGIMPLFALANSGVSLGNATLAGDSLLAFVGIGVGLVLGKPLGVIGTSWLATRFGLATLPSDITWKKLVVVGTVAGIGFTMSMFVAELALSQGALLETSKLAILVASATAAFVTLGLGLVLLRPVADGGEQR